DRVSLRGPHLAAHRPELAGLLHQPRGDLGEHLGPVGVEDLLRAEVADRPVVGLPEPGQDVVSGAHAAPRCPGTGRCATIRASASASRTTCAPYTGTVPPPSSSTSSCMRSSNSCRACESGPWCSADRSR